MPGILTLEDVESLKVYRLKKQSSDFTVVIDTRCGPVRMTAKQADFYGVI